MFDDWLEFRYRHHFNIIHININFRVHKSQFSAAYTHEIGLLVMQNYFPFETVSDINCDVIKLNGNRSKIGEMMV